MRDWDVASHWDSLYEVRDLTEMSWTEDEPTMSLRLFDALGVRDTDSVIDVGGGRSPLASRLLARGLRDVSVLDVSPVALRDLPADVTREVGDVTNWRAPRTYDVGHDRALLHFLSPGQVSRYVDTLRSALEPTGAVVIGAFSPEGPDSCSGLDVTRYAVDELTRVLGEDFDVVADARQVHRTPWGAEQSFQWIAARRRDAS